MKPRSALNCVLVLTLLVGACSNDDADATSTTTSSTTTAAPVTSLQAAESTTTSTAPPSSTTTTTVDPFGEASFPEYTIVAREVGTDGDTLVVLLDDDTGSLTDIDLQNVVIDVVDRFPPPILTVHIVADAAAADAVLATAPTEAEQELLDRHYYVRLEEGFRLVFTGPFADTPTTVLGS